MADGDAGLHPARTPATGGLKFSREGCDQQIPPPAGVRVPHKPVTEADAGTVPGTPVAVSNFVLLPKSNNFGITHLTNFIFVSWLVPVNSEEFIHTICRGLDLAQAPGILATLILDGEPISTGKLYFEDEHGAAQFDPEIDCNLDLWPAHESYLRLFDNGGPLVRIRNLRHCPTPDSSQYRLDFEPLSVPRQFAV